MEPVIECQGLTKRYGSLLAVDHVDLAVGRGEVFGFLGPNGAGKSTTIRMLLGLIRPDAGRALLFGQSVAAGQRRVLKRVGALVESPALYDYLSGRKNLEILSDMSGGCPRKRIDEVLELVGLSGRQKDRVGTYSHGMRQRLGLAQALLPKPELLVLDEPATGLDPEGIVEIRNLLRYLGESEQMTIFVSSHLLHEVQATCTDVGLLSRGRLVTRGRVADLLRQGHLEATIGIDDAARGREVLRSLPFVLAVESEDSALRVRVEAERLADANRALVAAGLAVSALVPRQGNLEELYMSVMTEAGHACSSAD
ncbi:MAG TPA: ABC transporter ATP-binding protein [Armatimonadota bacterium]|nr:ABC transporter ATP-binding protein [Armatimonadota bacterium]